MVITGDEEEEEEQKEGGSDSARLRARNRSKES